MKVPYKIVTVLMHRKNDYSAEQAMEKVEDVNYVMSTAGNWLMERDRPKYAPIRSSSLLRVGKLSTCD